MQATKFRMINNNVKTAQYRIAEHRTQGVHSQLSIFDVANLLDQIKRAESLGAPSNKPSIFQSIGFN
jgi:hypothetical protein|tara:strand:- start:19546 stop:19746 length:201 start_codon:yes stop_codon:yes gene_type:complete